MVDPKRAFGRNGTLRLDGAGNVVAPPTAKSPGVDLARTQVDPPVPTLPRPAAPGASFAAVELAIDDAAEPELWTTAQRKKWRAAEVWTKRRVYALDSAFVCMEVLDRESGLLDGSHELLGARLGGGRQRTKDGASRFSYPLPLPGMEAMFMKGKRHGYTSPVERMVLRVRLVNAAEEVPDDSPEDAPPPPRPPRIVKVR